MKFHGFRQFFCVRILDVIFKVQRGSWSPWASEPPDNPSWRTLLVNYVRRHAFPSFSRLLFLAAWLNDNARGRITCVTSVQSIPHRGKRVERRMGSGQERTYFHIITPWGRTFYPYCTCGDRSRSKQIPCKSASLSSRAHKTFRWKWWKISWKFFEISKSHETYYYHVDVIQNFDRVLKFFIEGSEQSKWDIKYRVRQITFSFLKCYKKTTEYFLKFLFLFESIILPVNNGK